MSFEISFIAAGTHLSEDGTSAATDLAAGTTRTFLCTMDITGQIEQESVDLSVWGSHDGEAWEKKPLLIMPQRFYKGETSQVLDLSRQPEIRYIRATWKLTRWGRGTPRPMFVLSFTAKEIPAFAHHRP